ncbi:MAG: hypothetical protein H6631_20640 [Anaerolineaceae bacterium]|nr:hypothetical protein [Anaerolineaceae bacterium]MCB9109551.1 hypothetical protein [Anaerolineales bacterium]
MTLAIALATNERRFGLAISLPTDGGPLAALLLAMLASILAGLCIDLALGLPIGVVTLWPAALSLGATLGMLIIELLGVGDYGQPESNRT